MSLYRTILSQSFKTIWQYKYLWFFGLFATFIGGGGSYEFVINGKLNDYIVGVGKFLSNTGILSRNFLSNLMRVATENPFSFFVIIFVYVMIFALFVFLLYMAISSQAALVNNVALIAGHKKHNLQIGLSVGQKNFLSVLGINIILKIVISLTSLFIGLPLIMSHGINMGVGWSLYYIISFILLVPVVIILLFIAKYAVAYVVIKKQKVLEAIKNGWNLFLKNWLVSIEMAFILLLINIVFNFCLLLAILILAIPFLLLFAIFYLIKSLFVVWLIVFLGVMCLIFFIALAASIISAFQISSWTYLFIRLVNQGGVSKIVRMFEKNKIR